MTKTILFAACLLPLLVSAASALPDFQRSPLLVSPYDIVKVKTAEDKDSWSRSRWRESQGEADWYDGNQDDRVEEFKKYSYRPPEDDSDCFAIERFWYCP
jgi:hypothetical protein